MFHRHNTSYKKKFLKNLTSRVYVYVLRALIVLRFHRLQRHHKIAILIASLSIFFVSISTIIMGVSSDSVLAQVRFQIAIRALHQCQNGIDDDSDGFIDYPHDSGCTVATDDTEDVFVTPLTGVCYPLVNTATVGQTVTWIASADNGTPPYSYNWSGTEGISGSMSLLQKIYTTSGIKTAAVVISSNGLSSLPTPCVSSVVITNSTSSNGGGGGGGGGGGNIGPSTNNIPSNTPSKNKNTVPILESAPPKDTKKIDDTPKAISGEQPKCFLPDKPTPQDTKNYLVCSGVLTKKNTEESYEYTRYLYRKELLAIATKMHLSYPDAQEKIKLSRLSSNSVATSDSPYHFLDVGLSGQPEWVSQTVEMGVVFNLISNQNTYFRPDDFSTRGEAFAMLMKSVCLNPDQSIQKTWEQRVYEVALRNGITSRSWRDFKPGDPILRQDTFLITARLNEWKNKTGGCDRYGASSEKEDVVIQKEHTQLDCPLPENPTPKEAEKYLVCENLLTPTTIEEKYDAHIQRSKILGLSLEIFLTHGVIKKDIKIPEFTLQFLDVGASSKQEPWVYQTVTQGVRYGLIANQKTYFRPTDYATRGEAFLLLLKSVCMNIDQSIQSTWQERLYTVAVYNGLTQKAWDDFDFDGLLERGELFILISKLDKWKHETGGCDSYPNLVPKYNEIPVLESAPVETKKSIQNTISNTQKPGTFALLYEDETKKVYSYIIKSGGIPDGVRAWYIRVFSGKKSISQRLSVHDIAGVEYAEDRWLLAGELIYVTLKK